MNMSTHMSQLRLGLAFLGVEFERTMLRLLRESKWLLPQSVTGIVYLEGSSRRWLSKFMMVPPEAKLIYCYFIFCPLTSVSACKFCKETRAGTFSLSASMVVWLTVTFLLLPCRLPKAVATRLCFYFSKILDEASADLGSYELCYGL